MIKAIRNLFKFAKLILTDDSGDLRFATVSTLGKIQKVMIMTPYGLMHNPPAGSLTAVFSQQGHESNGMGIADDPANRPIKDMAEGEVAIGNYLTEAYLYFDDDGNAALVVPNDLDTTVAGDSTETVTGTKTTVGTDGIVSYSPATHTFYSGGVFTITGSTIKLNGDADNLTMWAALNTQLQAFMASYNVHEHIGARNPPIPTHTLDISTAKATTLTTDG